MNPYLYSKQEPLLTIQDVSVRYDHRPVLNEVSQQICNVVRPEAGVQQGQVVAILGPSGIGKTTLFRVLSGMEEPTSGSVLITKDQVPVGDRMVGVVQQDYPLLEDRTVRKNLLIAASLARRNRKTSKDPKTLKKSWYRRWKESRVELNTIVDEMLESFDLKDQENQYPNQLSGGQRQRVAIAQQLLEANKYLLMDEPFSGQDYVRLRKTCDVIRKVSQRDEEFTIVLVTHDIHAALAVADTIWLMGRVRDENGKTLGAQFVEEIDLMQLEIAWRDDPRSLPQYLEVLRKIEERFPSL